MKKKVLYKFSRKKKVGIYRIVGHKHGAQLEKLLSKTGPFQQPKSRRKQLPEITLMSGLRVWLIRIQRLIGVSENLYNGRKKKLCTFT